MTDRIEQLERLARLHQSGALSDSEFDRAKAVLLAGEAGEYSVDIEPARRRARLPLFMGAALVAMAIGAGVWFASDFVPETNIPEAAETAKSIAQDGLDGQSASAAPVPVSLDETLAYASPSQCLAGEALERVYKKLVAGMDLGSGEGLTVTLDSFAAPLPVSAKSRKDQHGAEVAEAELLLPAGTTWHGLKVRGLSASRYYPPASDGQDARSFEFLEPAEKVQRTLAALGLNAPLAPEYKIMAKPGSCDGTMQIETRGSGSALVCNWGC